MSVVVVVVFMVLIVLGVTFYCVSPRSRVTGFRGRNRARWIPLAQTARSERGLQAPGSDRLFAEPSSVW